MVAGVHRRHEFAVTDSLVRRFWSRVDRRDTESCWYWQASFRKGYGAIKHQKHVLSAHRLSYVIHNGHPASNLVVAHKCDNPACCNPNHLEAVPVGTNNRDARGRVRFHCNKGNDVWNAQMDDDLVRRILDTRKATGFGSVRLIQHLGLSLSRSTVEKMLQNKTWKHVPRG
jgi:hypothetical protein